MSDVKRYEPSIQCVEPSYKAQMIEPIVREVAWGNFVRYEDYARLNEQNKQLWERCVHLAKYAPGGASLHLQFIGRVPRKKGGQP